MKTLKNTLLFMFLCISGLSYAQVSSLYSENYDSKGNWPERNNEIRVLKVFNGRYYFEHKRTTKFWKVTTRELDLDTSRDFEIETSIQKISGVSNYGFGLVYDSKNDNNARELLVTSGGSFRVAQKIDGDYKALKSWSESSAIKTGNYATNKLKVKKINNTLTFYINGTNVFSSSFEPFMSKKVSVIIYNKQKVSIDYIKVNYLSRKKNNTITNNSTSRTVLYDSFYSNRNNWPVGSSDNVDIEIKNSKYYFEYKKNKGWTSTKVIDDLDTSRDFKIEASIQKISGIQNNGYGLVFGRLNKGNQYQFIVTGSGSYAIDKYANGKFNSIKNWTKSSAVETGNYAINKLKVEKIGSTYKFYVNNTLVYSRSYLTLYGKRIGFAVFDPQKIAVDYLSISYLDSKPNNTTIFNNNNTISKGDAIFNDSFNNNNNEWLVNDHENYRFKINNGKYYIRHKRSSGGWATYLTKNIDTSRDFEIETKIDKISGVTNSSYGILWGLKGQSSFRVYLASTGYYKVIRMVNNESEDIKKWTKTSVIRTGNGASNTIKVKKIGDIYKLYINNRYVYQFDFEPFYGNKIGYVLYNDQEIAADYLRVNYLKKSTTTTVSNKTITAPFYDGFTSNTNGWNVVDNDNYSVALNNSRLRITRKKSGGIFISRNVNINTSKNFIIETALSYTKATSSGLYGITFGRKNSANEFTFLLSTGGSYMFRKFDNNKYHKIIPFTESEAIKKGSYKTNKVKIVKSDNLLRFYINDQYVNEVPYESFFGNKLGYTVYHDQRIDVNYLDVKYISNQSKFNSPPVITITSPNVTLKRGFKIVKTKTVTVTGKASDNDGIFEITINGTEANVSGDGSFSANVPLKYGKNDLIVKATDMKQASSTKTFTIKRSSANSNTTIVNNTNTNTGKLNIGFGKYYALLIGVSDYKDDSIDDLGGKPIRDAQALGNVLINNYNFNRSNVKILKNPTKNQIAKEFFRLRKIITEKDNLLIFYAGHGNYDEASELGYWMPSDAEMEFEGNIIRNSTIVDYFKAIKSRHTLLISDACFSGSILKTRAYKKAPKSVKRKYDLPSRKAITSGTLTTVPNESVFIKYLLKRLKSNNSNYISARQLFNMIEDPVINNTTGDNQPQYGTIHSTGDEGGDFIFIKK